MDFVLNRSGGVPLRDQIVSQLEMKILAGELPKGRKLPSVRSLARQIRVHPRTVYAAYKSLQAAGQLDLARGSGAFVRRGAPASKGDTHDLEEMLRGALRMAFRQGFTGSQIRQATRRWLATPPPSRILVVDAAHETAELLVAELRGQLGVSLQARTLEDVAKSPGQLSRGLVVTLPFHVDFLRGLAPEVALIVVTLHISAENRRLITSLPSGGLILVVSYSPRVLPYARTYLQSLRGHDVVVDCHLLSNREGWDRLIGAADLVFADALSVADVRRRRLKGVREFRVLDANTLGEIHDALLFAVPTVAPKRGA